MSKPIKKVRSKKVGEYRLRLTTYGPDRGAMIELLAPENLEYGLDEQVYEGHYMHKDNAEEVYREIKTGKQAIAWAWRNEMGPISVEEVMKEFEI